MCHMTVLETRQRQKIAKTIYLSTAALFMEAQCKDMLSQLTGRFSEANVTLSLYQMLNFSLSQIEGVCRRRLKM